jgi:murein L,D-transpeptidase YcbB/YkuD
MRTVVLRSLSAMLAVAALSGCRIGDGTRDETVIIQETEPGALQPAAPGAWDEGYQGLRLEVSLSARELRVYEAGRIVERHPVAVGQPEYPTPTGEYTITQVIWNPEWIPPDSDWAEDEERRPPGDPDNPLGRAQLVFDAPYSIHGTDETGSLGERASHGSVRLANDVIVELAPRVMEAGGAARSDTWLQQARENTNERRSVQLRNPVPIRIVEH